ncbi:MAG: phage integrase SAM-like domain-containing protein [Candidatus Omnitrophica bacterium]|nr:phage integrase SAM-like domain-containing protein [Candidatus Omnitrophota bacterium]
MGTVHKIGETYYIEFEARGLKYQQIAGDNKEAAMKLLESIEAKIRHGQMGVVVRDIPIAVFFKDYFEFARISYPAKTVARLEQLAKHFTGFLNTQYPNVMLLSGLTPKVIEDYKYFISRSEQKPWVINFSLLLLREIFEHALKLGYLNDNPTLHIRFVPDQRRNCIVKASIKEILDKGVSLFRLAHLLKFSDVLRAMIFFRYLRNPMAE